MKKTILILVLGTFAIIVQSQITCPNVFKCGTKFVDPRDSFSYPTLQIGTQCWFQVNLHATKYINGDSINHVTNATSWGTPTTGAWCDYNNDTANGIIYGHLYNWYAVYDRRGLCPMGWYVPTENEWNILINYLGGPSVAGGAMKSTTPDRIVPNVGATSRSGFTALPGGQRPYSPAQFISFGYFCEWRTCSFNGSAPQNGNLWMCNVQNNTSATSLQDDYWISGGDYVRCIKEY